MVWFQCDDCGENLKKPKLQNHFRRCSATKLSCIDCGIVFTQQSVQGHTQCISETEKYGPKGVVTKKEDIQTPRKENNSNGVDLTLGLSTKPPWNCSLCNVKTTSQETLVLHSEGKKHKAKARSLSLKNSNCEKISTTAALTQTPFQSSVPVNGNGAAVLLGDETAKENQEKFQPEDESRGKNGGMVDGSHNEADGGEESCSITSEKKRRKSGKRSMEENNSERIKDSYIQDANNCITKRRQVGEDTVLSDKVVNDSGGLCDANITSPWQTKLKTIKWKKLIKRTLQDAPDSKMKLKKFRKTIISLAMEKVGESGDEALFTELDKQIKSFPKLVMDGNRVWLQS